MYRFLFRHRFQDDLFIGPVHSLLTEPDSGHPEPKRVYDLGTGTAAWYVLAWRGEIRSASFYVNPISNLNPQLSFS